ncbi:MAG: transposase [Promethearchaeota archaeon]
MTPCLRHREDDEHDDRGNEGIPPRLWREDLARGEGDEPGRPGELSDSPFRFAALPRVARGIPWRQLERGLGVWCEPCGLPLPSYSTLHRRRATVSLEPLPRPVAVAVDSTGLKVSGSEEYLRAEHRFIRTVQERVDEHSPTKPAPHVTALTSLFGGEYYYDKLVGQVCHGGDTILLGASRSGKTAVRRALTGNLTGLFVRAEIDKLGGASELSSVLEYIPGVNEQVEIVPHPVFGNEQALGTDFVITRELLQEFADYVGSIRGKFEKTGFVRGPFYCLQNYALSKSMPREGRDAG